MRNRNFVDEVDITRTSGWMKMGFLWTMMDVARACGRKNLGVCGWGGWMKKKDVALTCGWKTWMLFSRDPKEAGQRASSEGQRRRPEEKERSGEGTVRVHECVAQ
jgi:hypothetical protein